MDKMQVVACLAEIDDGNIESCYRHIQTHIRRRGDSEAGDTVLGAARIPVGRRGEIGRGI